jgi:putative cardiolipin synthase
MLKTDPLRALALAALLVLVAACASLPVDYPRTESHALTDTAGTRLGRAAEGPLRAHPGENGFHPLPNGVDALLMRLYLAEAAERSLDLMYYIWHDDLVGRHLAAAVLRAADRGVRVRLLVDDLGTNPDDNAVLALDAHPNVEVRLFNPVASRSARLWGALTDFGRVNRRMHNKAFIADNQRVILGGRNIGDEYFGAHTETDFGDLDVVAAGPVVAEVSAAFDRYWNSPVVYPISALAGRQGEASDLETLRRKLGEFIESQRDTPYVQTLQTEAATALATAPQLYWGKAHLLVDDPAKVTRTQEETEGHLLPQFAQLGLDIGQELTIVSPYFIPGDAGVQWLLGLVKRGVRVTVLTNSLASNDVPSVYAGYKRYREPLVEGGVRLYELKPEAIAYAREKGKRNPQGSRASLHAKTFFFDRRSVFVGSLNLDPRSIKLNTEIGMVCESAPMTEALLAPLEKALDRIAWRIDRVVDPSGQARLVWVETDASGVRQLDQEPEVSTWRRFSVWFLGLLPIESQL